MKTEKRSGLTPTALSRQELEDHFFRMLWANMVWPFLDGPASTPKQVSSVSTPIDFDTWFETTFNFAFGTRWIKNIVKRFCAAGWDAAMLRK